MLLFPIGYTERRVTKYISLYTYDVNQNYLLATPSLCVVRGDVRGGDSTSSLQPSAWPRATSTSLLDRRELEEGWEGSGDEAMYVSVVCFASTSPSPCSVNKSYIYCTVHH